MDKVAVHPGDHFELDFHHLTGGRKGMWSLTVTRNWRITFGIDQGKKEIFDLDYEDYH